MFYNLISRKRDSWLASEDCPVKNILTYIRNRGYMRDAQLDAIKTYLYLKIACGNRPLAELFCQGVFNTLTKSQLDEMSIPAKTRRFLLTHPEAVALYEFASSEDDKGKFLAEKIKETVEQHPENIDYQKTFERIFYNTTYTDYIFSLPMGAGKTFLMAAFIYLDLYFALNEPHNPAFAHNFMIMAPSGLKSSVVPSLKTIENFDPATIIPEPTAGELKRLLKFEVLDQVKTDKKSNKTRNPNVQKITTHQPFEDMFGVVFVANAEKVILEKYEGENKRSAPLFGSDEGEVENELRTVIKKIPHLAVFIDEVHHAAAANQNETKLRDVVEEWAASPNGLNSVIGFSGTPYLFKQEKIDLSEDLSFKNQFLSNSVNYYPLVKGINNFLKRPVVKYITDAGREDIVEQGLRDFFALYKDTVYADGTCAKVAVYCGTIATLEEVIYPIASRIAEEFGLNPATAVLKFHEGSKAKDGVKYAAPANARLEFSALDTPLSKVRIVLLVQIGKEGWDCRSLTGVILSQEGDCPKNMVLQTSCRCLRQVVKDEEETALIYLNERNYQLMAQELEKSHHATIDEFQKGGDRLVSLNRYNRMEIVDLPALPVYQMKVEIGEVLVEKPTPAQTLENIQKNIEYYADRGEITTQKDFFGTRVNDAFVGYSRGKYVTFRDWLKLIVKEGFMQTPLAELLPFEEILRKIYAEATVQKEGKDYLRTQFRQQELRTDIRKAFIPVYDYETKKEKIKENLHLLKVESFSATCSVDHGDVKKYIPPQSEVEQIHRQDTAKPMEMTGEDKTLYDLLVKNDMSVQDFKNKHPEYFTRDVIKDTYHYLPYHTDSALEREFFAEVRQEQAYLDKKLEVYYNGDNSLTDFKIKCYKKDSHNQWEYIGKYTPDFLIMQRCRGRIAKVLIVETKGNIYAKDPHFLCKKDFTMQEFLAMNSNAETGVTYDYLYIEDGSERRTVLREKIKVFFDIVEE